MTRAPHVALVAGGVALAACAPRPALVGTWRVVAIESRDTAGGAWRRPFGDAPRGYAVYAADGTHLLQFGRTPSASFAARDDRAGTDAEVRAAFLDHFAWQGRWRVDAARGVVVHEIEGSAWPSYRNTVQERPYRLKGDTLVLGDTTRARRVFVRVRP